jgi:ADP-ribose pyrophosphatase YjhB (NUDIX family)
VSLPIKHSVAVVVRNGNQILTIRRPDDDDELPGVWGLPAGSFKPGETLDDLVARIGRHKLGVSLVPVRKLAGGSQARAAYHLEMELWEVAMGGLPDRSEWKWSPADALAPGRAKGSLCCDLALKWLEGG